MTGMKANIEKEARERKGATRVGQDGRRVYGQWLTRQ